MNKRILELAEEAGAETWSRSPMRAVTGLAFTDENLEKFAELIIQECIDLVNKEQRNMSQLLSNPLQNGGIFDSMNSIRYHFGMFKP